MLRASLFVQKIIYIDSYVKYNFPIANPGPFDPDYKGNYFVFANGYSNLSGDISDFNLQSFEANIPTGYKTIIVCHRIALIDNSKLLQEWKFDNRGNIRVGQTGGKYIITTEKTTKQFRADWNQHVDSLAVLRPDAPDASINSMTWDDPEQCKEYALTQVNTRENKALVSVILDTLSWH